MPYWQFIPWLMQHGLDMDLFMRELFATRIGAFFAFDVVVSALALFVFVFTERTVARVRHVWLPVVATLVVGVSLGLPLISLHAATLSRCRHTSNQAIQPIAKAMFALCVSYSCD